MCKYFTIRNNISALKVDFIHSMHLFILKAFVVHML